VLRCAVQKSKEPCGTTAVPPGVVLVTITKRQPSSKWQRSSKRLRRS
jgi:hypothetical protein